MFERKLALGGLILAGMILLLYLAGGEESFGRQKIAECEKLWEESEKVFVEGEVYQKTRKEEKLIVYLKDIQGRGQNMKGAVADERLLVYLEEGGYGPGIGQRILVTGEAGFFEAAANPGNFDQRNYYKQQKIRMALWNGRVLEEEKKLLTFSEKLWRVKSGLAGCICKKIGQRYGGILSAILLGESAWIEEEGKEIYRLAGIGHLLAVSGLHISFFGFGIYHFLRRLHLPIWTAGMTGSAMLGVYVIMTGSSISAKRAFIMFLVRMGAEILGREYDGLTALGIAEILLLLQDPLLLFSSGFHFSFGAVLGIYLTGQRKKEGKIWAAIQKSVSLQFFLLPITLWNYYEICLYSSFWNALVIPAATLVMISGSMGIAAGFFPGSPGKGVQLLFWQLAKWILLFYEKGSDFLLALPGARWVPGKPAIWQIICYYMILFPVLWGVQRKKQEAKRYRKFRLMLGMLLMLLIGLPKGRRGQMELTMLDIGQGDCFFFRDGTGKNYLIDGGSSSVDQVGKYRIEPFLKSQGVKRLDYVWVTHGDADHMNGIEEILKRKKYGVSIERLILPEESYWDEKLKKMCRKAKQEKTRVFVMEQEKVFQNGKLEVQCLWPGGEKKAEDANENSLVLHLQYGKFFMLFTGDLEKEGEEMVVQKIRKWQEDGKLPPAYDILKVGHHGSKNATGEELLETIKPKAAFCSSGKGNRYGHPHAETLERLAKWGVSLYNTKDRGAVSMYTDGRKYGIQSP